MLEELGRHGYGVSYGTLYPALYRMEEDGHLVREDRVEGCRARKYYSATKKALKELERVRLMVRELHHEVVEGEGRPRLGRAACRRISFPVWQPRRYPDFAPSGPSPGWRRRARRC